MKTEYETWRDEIRGRRQPLNLIYPLAVCIMAGLAGVFLMWSL